MAYPGRKPLPVLEQFAGSASPRPTVAQRAALLEIVAQQYPAGRSLRELAEVTGRTQQSVSEVLRLDTWHSAAATEDFHQAPTSSYSALTRRWRCWPKPAKASS